MAIAISTARVEITPQPGAVMGGYGMTSGPRLADDTYYPLTARCLVIWDSGYPNVVVSVDLLGMTPRLVGRVRSALASQVSDTDLMLLASHTHNGPALVDGAHPWITYAIPDTGLPALAAYTDALADTLVGLVTTALNGPQTPVTLDYQATSQSWSRNRAGLPYNETAVPVLVARAASGQPLAVAYSYGCHPVSAGIQSKWDGDYPAAASAVIEAAIPGAIALYIPGPAGDQDPAGTRGWRLRDQLGAQLGAAVVTAASTVGRSVSGPILTSLTTLNLPLDVPTTAAARAQIRPAYVNRAANGQYAWYKRHGQWMVDQIDAGTPFPTTVPMPIQVWKFSGTPLLKWVNVGGELVSGYAVYHRTKHGGPNGLIIGGYGNGCCSYLPSNELLPPYRTTSSYEGGWDTDAPTAAGGSQTAYGRQGHYLYGTGGVEKVLDAAFVAQLG